MSCIIIGGSVNYAQASVSFRMFPVAFAQISRLNIARSFATVSSEIKRHCQLDAFQSLGLYAVMQ